MCPIIGVRYNLSGQDYDLCQAEYDNLTPEEQEKYTAIDPPPPETTNMDLVEALKDRGVLHTAEYITAFQQVDRALFLPETTPAEVAYEDKPIRLQPPSELHQSAPHICE